MTELVTTSGSAETSEIAALSATLSATLLNPFVNSGDRETIAQEESLHAKLLHEFGTEVSRNSDLPSEDPHYGRSDPVDSSGGVFSEYMPLDLTLDYNQSDANTLVSHSTHLSERAVGLSLLPDQSREFYKRKGSSFTLMVAGAAGSGKTTFLNTLFDSGLISENQNREQGPTASVQLHKFELVEEGFKLNFTAIDTPGFGERIDNRSACAPLTSFIDEQFRLYLYRSEQPDRRQLMDTRVHCCLYFISPSGTALKPLDISTMKELSARVNVIPVISKGDTLSEDNLIKFKAIVRKTLKLNDIKVCDLILDREVNASINHMVPFVVVGSNEWHENTLGKTVRGRKYKWGIVEVENPLHCDFVKLRDVLMGNNMLDLMISTETHYDNYRANCLQRRASEQLLIEGKDAFFPPGADGLFQYQVYHKFTLDLMEEFVRMSNPVYELEQKRIRDEFNFSISHQEKRFKDWKKALVEKQNSLNEQIEAQHALVVQLTEETTDLTSIYSASDISPANESEQKTSKSRRSVSNRFSTSNDHSQGKVQKSLFASADATVVSI